MVAAVQVAEARNLEDCESAARLAEAVWGSGAPLTARYARALQLGGGYLAVARAADGTPLGCSAGFLGMRAGRLVLHSHVTAVAAAARTGGVGRALKLHQRGWCLERGVGSVQWTFDPLIRRNAWFNQVRLGARVVAYLPDAYGPVDDDVNAGDATDRLLVWWDLEGPSATAALAGAVLAAAGTGAGVLAVGPGGGPAEPPAPPAGVPVTVAVPADVEDLRRRDRTLARRWRAAVRHHLGGRMAAGWTVEGMTADRAYLLRPPAGPAG